ncbi:MAG TPA: Ig-like domain-containing protein, partial [Vicinamibacterales bacterium]
SLTAVARDAAGNSTISSAVAVTVDNAPPAISITNPTAGARLSGAINVSADASDNIGVAGVQFRLDGVALGAEDTSAPYTIPWDTRTASNGSHTLTAVARDTIGHSTTSATVAVTVDNASMVITITAPTAGAMLSGAITVSADASGAGLAGVQFRLDGTALGAEDTSAPYAIPWDTRATSNGSHTLTAVARDAAGNTTTSSPVTVTVSNTSSAPASATRFENTDISIAYTPGTTGPPAWFHGSRSRDWSNGTASFNRSTGARATFGFTGTEVSWIGFRAFWAGIARVYVDDVFRAEVDLFLPMCTPEQQAQGCVHEEDEEAVFTATGLALGSHTLTVEVTGGRNPAATDNAVVVDAFDVVRSSPLTPEGTRAQETAASFTGAWTQGDTTAAWSGGTAARSVTAGARAAVTFVGTEVRWLGLRGPATGIARIFLDGSFHAQVDTYSPTAATGVVFMATGLAAGSHVLTVEVTGSRNAAATGHAIFVDAFDVRARFEERGQSISYAGTWIQEHMDLAWSGTTPNTGSGTAALSATAGATATFTFTGTAVSWIGFRGPVAGIANVYLDGALVAQPDMYAPADQIRVPVFTMTNLAPGSHTLRIEVTGQRNGAALGANVIVDALDVTPSSPAPVSRVEQTAPSVVFTPGTGWTQSSPSAFFSGQTVALSTTPGARAELTFTGASVRWIGQMRRDSGIARVYLDGTFIVQVDSFTLIQDEFQAAMFTATGLTPGQHVLTIEVTGEKHPSSSGAMVIVDAFEVY